MVVLGPFNFPGHLPNGHIVPALLAGNTVIFKPSEQTPLVTEQILKCWESSKIPKGVINMIHGKKTTGRYLLEHPDIDGLLFTGSYQTGRELAMAMAKTPGKILALEMGGNNPLIVGTVKNKQIAAYLTIQSAYLTSGQRCTCARRLIVNADKEGELFLETLIEMIKSIRVGSYHEVPEPFMGPVISIQSAHNLLQAERDLVAKGATPIIPLKTLDEKTPFLTPGLIDVTHVADRPDEEFFGPLLQVIRVKSHEEAIKEANRTKYGLAAGLLSDHKEEFQQFYDSVKAGIVNWNMPLTGASSAAPFGGVKESGNNRPSAYYAADYCAYPIASQLNYSLDMPASVTPGIAFKDTLL
jgi:succinylglutamic semialdehyde dehydrogenase